MAGDWIKVEKATARKPEVLRLADLLGIHPDHAFGLCVRFWFWCDDQLVDGHAPSVTYVTLNSVVGHAGFAEALAQIGWLSEIGGKMVVPNFDRHISASAKSRALSVERKRKERGGDVTVLSRSERDESVTREEGDERKNHTSPDGWNTDGSASCERPSSHASHASKDVRNEIRDRKKADLSGLDWDEALRFAEAAARRIPPIDERDRRAWIRFGVLAATACSEGWLVDTADAVSRMPEVKKTRQACFVAALKIKAKELWGIDEPTFSSLVRMIEIPTDVWKSPVLEVRK